MATCRQIGLCEDAGLCLNTRFYQNVGPCDDEPRIPHEHNVSAFDGIADREYLRRIIMMHLLGPSACAILTEAAERLRVLSRIRSETSAELRQAKVEVTAFGESDPSYVPGEPE